MCNGVWIDIGFLVRNYKEFQSSLLDNCDSSEVEHSCDYR